MYVTLCFPSWIIVHFIDYDPFNVWSLIQEDFIAHLPLRNLHWKSSTRPLRSIQSLEIEMRPYQPSAEEQPHQMPISLLQRPYVNIMFVKCDVMPNGFWVWPCIGQWDLSKPSAQNNSWMVQWSSFQTESGMDYPTCHNKGFKWSWKIFFSIYDERLRLR